MINALIELLIFAVLIGLVAALVVWLIDMLPIDGHFKRIARAIVGVITVLVILLRALPLLGVSV
jgi:hypothetical protein